MSEKLSENEFIEKFARRWNEKFKIHCDEYVGWINIERMLRLFLKAYKRRKKK